MSRAPQRQAKRGRAPGSAWMRVPVPAEMAVERALMGPGEITAFQRLVYDGHLTVFVDRAMGPGPDGDRMGWHLSISHRTNTNPPQPGRYPTWDEISAARSAFLPDEIQVVMCLPPRRQWVNDHETCFHLWELPEAVYITGSG